MSVRPLFKGFALTFILYNCRKRDYSKKPSFLEYVATKRSCKMVVE